jgi:hypothetical protein
MAGNWIKVEHVTPDKPEIIAVAQALGIDQDAVFGKCLRIWIWADQQTIDGNDLSVTAAFLDRLTNCPGFSDALKKVGWLASRSGRFLLPNFDRHNGQTAKNRALTNDRVKRLRNDITVTQSLPDQNKSKKEDPPLPPNGLREQFEAFRQAYPGRKRGLAPEFANFEKKFGARIGAILPLLLPAARAYAVRCAAEGIELRFRKHMQTWVNQECWTEETPAPPPPPPPLPDDGYRPDSLWGTDDV